MFNLLLFIIPVVLSFGVPSVTASKYFSGQYLLAQQVKLLPETHITPIPTPTPTGMPTPTPTIQPTATPTPTPTITTTPTPTPVPIINTAPPAGTFRNQSVQADTGVFNVAIISANLNSTRVIVDTASDHDCSNDCPVLPLADYAARNGAFAAINGTFFCPTEYPQCAGKTNSFDTLLMNKNKVYFNSANNVYSTVPLVYFTGTIMGVREQTLQWGRDTGVDSVIAMQPLLVHNHQNVYGGSNDGKYTNKGTRDFIAHIGSTVYIGTIYGADMDDAAKVLTAMGMEDAINLDEGGSTALMYNGSYIAGPGRNIPNAVLFVHK